MSSSSTSTVCTTALDQPGRPPRSPGVEHVAGDLLDRAGPAAPVDGERCTSYFHNAAGDIVTQLPHTSGWYREATEQIDRADFAFGGRVTRRPARA